MLFGALTRCNVRFGGVVVGSRRCLGSFNDREDGYINIEKVSEEFHKEGYSILPRLFSSEAIWRLREQALKLVEDWKPSDDEFSIFQTSLKQVETTDEYFLTSGSKISFFLESDTLSPSRE